MIKQERMVKLNITSRIKKIISILLSQQEYITAQEISEQINVSTRTVLRELENVEKILEEKKAFLEKKKGFGIKIIVDEDRVDEIKEWINIENNELIDSPEQRHIVLKARLLKSQEPTKLYNFTEALNVTESTIGNDLDSITPWFEKFELKLIRKPGLGIYISGSEKSLRRAIVALLYDHFHEIDLINLIIQNQENEHLQLEFSKIDKVLYDLMETEDVPIIKALISEFEGLIGYRLADHSLISLMIRFIVTIKRIHLGHTIKIDKVLKEKLKSEKIFIVIEQWGLENDNRILKDLTEDELLYLVMHIKGSKLQDTYSRNGISMIEDFKMMKLAKKMIRIAEVKTHTYLEDNEKLLNGLVRHLGPAINRIKLKLDVMNPLVKEIKEMYPFLYQVAQECVKAIEEEEKILVPEDEVAFIATHIGSAIKSENRRRNNKYRVVIACGNGIGTSQLLATEIEKEFHNIDIVDIVSTLEIDMERIKKINIDLIITTVPVYSEEMPFIQVNYILTEEDKKNIKKFLDNFIPSPYQSKNFNSEHLRDKIIRLKQYSNTILQVMDYFDLIDDIEIADINDLIAFASKKIVQSDEGRSELEKAFRDREEKGSTILGQKSMMLLHTRSSAVNKLYFMVLRGKEKIPILNNKNKMVNLDVIAVMVAPISITSIELEVLSEISRMIITSEFADILKNGTRQEIFYELSTILDSFLQTKVVVTE